jgi:predicted enzyme related to lactoylglutathione lyase
MANPFVHVELNSTNLGQAKAFYQGLFDWKLEEMPLPVEGAEGSGEVYVTIDPSGGTGGGMMRQMMPGAPSSWLAYVHVGNIRESTDKARRLGATVLKDVSEVKGMGWLSILRDPTGALIGLWQPASK